MSHQNQTMTIVLNRKSALDLWHGITSLSSIVYGATGNKPEFPDNLCALMLGLHDFLASDLEPLANVDLINPRPGATQN